MFTKGQIAFGILFAIAFIAIIAYMYRKDSKLHRKYYKGSIWVLIGFIGFLLMLAAIKFVFM
ncbi:hypothetical protein [Winogradskyella sp. 3972H.M.0a.05]|uniref:hypothetical protein n=1 Tax=Winogradskyella sp. 3972H.M.0a.05 TaxID=2950277 RepID=UPI003396CF8E